MLGHRNRKCFASLALLALVLLDPHTLFAWGNEGHTYVNRVAAEKIPRDMPRLLRKAVAEIAYLGPEPDRWRSPTEFALKNAQEPDHFIDLERVAWLNPLPRGRSSSIASFQKRASTSDHPDDYLPERVGLQPYITMEVYDRLKVGFREYRKLKADHQPTAGIEHAIIFYAAWLGHYVADGAQPLHTTIQYNGWVGPNPNGYTTQHDIHSNFETAYVGAHISAKDFSEFVHAPQQLNDPFMRYIAYLKTYKIRTGRKGVHDRESGWFSRERFPGSLCLYHSPFGGRIANAAELVVHGVAGERVASAPVGAPFRRPSSRTRRRLKFFNATKAMPNIYCAKCFSLC